MDRIQGVKVTPRELMPGPGGGRGGVCVGRMSTVEYTLFKLDDLGQGG